MEPSRPVEPYAKSLNVQSPWGTTTVQSVDILKQDPPGSPDWRAAAPDGQAFHRLARWALLSHARLCRGEGRYGKSRLSYRVSDAVPAKREGAAATAKGSGVHMIVTANDIGFNCEIEGRDGAPWLTFSNSLATDLTMWDEQVRAFVGDYRILRYDTRGHGGSTAGTGPYSLDMLADDVIAIWDKIGIDRSHVVGLSIGAMTAVGLALRHAERLNCVVVANARPDNPPELRSARDRRITAVELEGISGIGSTHRRTLVQQFLPDVKPRCNAETRGDGQWHFGHGLCWLRARLAGSRLPTAASRDRRSDAVHRWRRRRRGPHRCDAQDARGGARLAIHRARPSGSHLKHRATGRIQQGRSKFSFSAVKLNSLALRTSSRTAEAWDSARRSASRLVHEPIGGRDEKRLLRLQAQLAKIGLRIEPPLKRLGW